MKKYIYILFVLLVIPIISNAQTIYYTESFESCDTNTLPQGWFKFCNLNIVPLYPYSNWTVRDSGKMLPGIEFTGPGRGQRSYDGLKGLGVTWWSTFDTSGSHSDTADCWLITKRFNNIPADGGFSFYACGGSASYGDSMQVLISTTDSTFSSFTKIETLHWQAPQVFGDYLFYYYSLAAYAGQNIRIAFRYVSDYTNGFAVMLDYFQMYGSVGINQIGTNVPSKFDLKQNYPNPFNPTTKIKFDLAKVTNVKLEVYNSLGQLVQTLFSGYKPAGYYETDFTAKDVPSGVYFYRLTTDYYTNIKKMVVVK